VQERTAVMVALTARANLQQAMGSFLELRSTKSGLDMDAAEGQLAKVTHFESCARYDKRA
jgi:hypothetical protein